MAQDLSKTQQQHDEQQDPTVTTISSSPISKQISGLPSQQLDVERITRAWRAFMAYRGLSLQVFDTQALSFQHLPDTHQLLIPTVPIRLSHAAEAAEHNADLLERISVLTGVQTPFIPEETHPQDLELTVIDFPDVVDTLLAITRDWSSYGKKDRSRLYDCIIDAVQEAADDALSTATAAARSSTASSDRLPSLDMNQQQQIQEESNLNTEQQQIIDQDGQVVVPPFCVLVVGASLGRLAWELARLGFSVQGVEKSYLQLFTSNFILNGIATPENPLHLYPFIHHTAMVSTADEQLREIQFPDVDPRQLEQADFSMVAGDFVQLYKEKSVWDCIVTCFSLENAKNIITYIRRIADVLKAGGVWVNHGSLDFRYEEDMTTVSAGINDNNDNSNDMHKQERNIEISKEELELVIARCGLRVLRRESFQCRPPFFVNGMVHEDYESVFFVAVKV